MDNNSANTAQHTPGPWTCGTIDNSILAKGPQFCDLVIARTGNQGIRTEANARLIAAAPELLGALKAVLRADEAICSDAGSKADQAMTRIAALDLARAAIAKARPLNIFIGQWERADSRPKPQEPINVTPAPDSD